jgi:CheY-like chemotaxis protein
LQDQLAKAQHLEAIGRLAAGAAHDFNNLLTPILGCAEMICLNGAADARSREWAKQILEAAERAGELTRQFLAFSRKQVLEVRRLDVNEVIRGFQKLLRRLVRENIEVELRLAPRLGSVRADRSQLEQVVMNLTINAADAMPRGGRIRIETMDLLLDPSGGRAFPGAEPGAYVQLAVSDTGVGMEPAVLARVFEPFFTTKDVGKGTGLGLSTVYGVVRQQGGYVTAESTPGVGTIFRVLLPTERGPAETVARRSAQEERGGTESVLVVEDQEAVRSVVRQVLEGAGYGVVAASGPGEALEAARQAREIHLLLTDVVLPDMNGVELFRAVGEIRPGLKVLYMSAYATDEVSPHGVLQPGVAFLQKPFRPDALLHKVRAVLDGPSADEP